MVTPDQHVSPLRSLVIGYGSVGTRHEAVLRSMGAATAVVSRRLVQAPCPVYQSSMEALHRFAPEYVVVANRTVEHVDTLEELRDGGYSGICLVEKPLFSSVPPRELQTYPFRVVVGYLLRFHPLIAAASELVANQPLFAMHARVGQYLPDWRPETDYRVSYSARRDQGGGALRDLSHELDYLMYLGGAWRRVAALGGCVSDLDIDSDDTFSLLLELARVPVCTCFMDYLDRNPHRDCAIHYGGGSLYLDFMQNRLIHNGAVRGWRVERNDLFVAMHRAVWQGACAPVCTYAEALETVGLIDAAEESMRTNQWIYS